MLQRSRKPSGQRGSGGYDVYTLHGCMNLTIIDKTVKIYQVII